MFLGVDALNQARGDLTAEGTKACQLNAFLPWQCIEWEDSFQRDNETFVLVDEKQTTPEFRFDGLIPNGVYTMWGMY